MVRALRVCFSLLVVVVVVVVVVPAVLCAPAGDSERVSTKAAPYVSDFVDWNSVRDKTICPAQVAYDRELRVLQIWCADGVEGQRFEARGAEYVCRSLRYTIQSGESHVDVLGGCIARLDDAKPQD